MPTSEANLNDLEHTYIGPSWTRGPLGNFLTPEDFGLKTLGWQIAAWCTAYLNGLDGGRWVFTNEQFRLLLWWYAVDEHGRFAYRKGVLQRLKGWGKDPFAAVLALVEFVGPSQFSHWAEDGEPVGKAHSRSYASRTKGRAGPFPGRDSPPSRTGAARSAASSD
jgi:hypothetical protein